MNRIKLTFLAVLGLALLGLNFFLAHQAGKALYLLPSVVVVSIASMLAHRPSWFIGFIFLLFFDLRAEVTEIPIHLWEFYLLAVVPFLFKPGKLGLNRIEVALFVLFSVSLASTVLNSSYATGLKSAVRWIEYLLIYRIVRFAAAPLIDSHAPTSFSRILAVPLLALALFGIVQATVIKEKWITVLSGKTGALILGPKEAESRALRNNFAVTSESSDAFRSPGFYLSAVDLSAIFMISIATLYLKGSRAPMVIGATLVACGALILTMGRAALLYGAVSIIIATLLYKRRAQTLVSLGAVLCVLVLCLLAYAPARDRLFSLAATEQNAEEERTLIWQTGLNIWKSSPIYGKGGGSTAQYFDAAASVDWLAGRQATTHSTYIGTLAELGAVGLAAWLFFLWSLQRNFARSYYSSETKAVLCFVLVFFMIMGVSSDTYTAGNPYFVFLLLLFGWHDRESTGLPLEELPEPEESQIQVGSTA